MIKTTEKMSEMMHNIKYAAGKRRQMESLMKNKKILIILIICICAALVIIFAVRSATESRMRVLSPDKVKSMEEIQE